jgi:hypothetical protein
VNLLFLACIFIGYPADMPIRTGYLGQGYEHYQKSYIAAKEAKWLQPLRNIDGDTGDTSNGLWDKTNGCPERFKANISSILDGVAQTLTDKSTSLLREADGEQHRCLFNKPLTDPNGDYLSPCMPFDKMKVQATKHMYVDKIGGYLCLKLGSNSTTKAPIYVRAHCLVYWALRGPDRINKPLVAHACRNPKCLNPRHLTWSTARDNAPCLRRGKGYSKVKKARRLCYSSC